MSQRFAYDLAESANGGVPGNTCSRFPADKLFRKLKCKNVIYICYNTSFSQERDIFIKYSVCSIRWPISVTAKSETSRQNQKLHGKNRNSTAKSETLRQNQKLQGKI